MVKVKASPADEWEMIPDGEVVNAIFDGLTEDEFEWPKGSGEIVENWKWTFVVTDEEWRGQKITGKTSTAFTAHPNCKAYNWVTAITGKSYGDGEMLDTDDLIGMPCRIVTKHSKPDKFDRIWVNVGNVLKPKGVVERRQEPEDAPF